MNKNKFMYYFNMEEEGKEEIKKMYNVISVPSILVIENGDFYIITDNDNNKIIEELIELL